VNPKRPKTEPISNPTLFDREKLKEAATVANKITIERPYSLPGILLAFTASGCARF
jgi:hypothetical protein